VSQENVSERILYKFFGGNLEVRGILIDQLGGGFLEKDPSAVRTVLGNLKQGHCGAPFDEQRDIDLWRVSLP
jgi:hypothetical protein